MTVENTANRAPALAADRHGRDAESGALSFGPLERSFVLRFLIVFGLVLVVPWAVGLLGLPGPMRYAAAVATAGILVGVYLRRPVEALLALALLMLFNQTVNRYVAAPMGPVDELAAGLIFLIAGARALPAWREWVWLPRDASVLLVALFGVVSSVSAGVPLSTWLVGLVLLGKSIAFLYAVMWTPFRAPEIRGAMVSLLGVAVVVLVAGFVELLIPNTFRETLGLNAYASERSGTPVVKSLFVHPAPFGWMTTFVALFGYAAYVVTRRWRWLIVGLAFSLGPMLSARRRAILALIAGLAIGVVETRRRIPALGSLARTWAPVAGSVVIVLAVFSSGLTGLYQLTLERYVDRPGSVIDPGLPGEPAEGGDSDSSPQVRIALYRGSVEIAADYFPLGGGLGRYASWMSRVDYSPLYEEYGLSDIRGLRPNNPTYATDTFWPQILGELGVFGLLAYATFAASIALVLWREAARQEGPLTRVLRLGAGMVFAQAIVESLASSMFHSPPRVYLLYLAVGIVLSLAWRREEPAERRAV